MVRPRRAATSSTVEVRARIEGNVDAVLVREGQHVAAGQLLARATRTDQGENTLDEPFVPGESPSHPPVMTFEGVVERTRQVEIGARWWPASGVDVAAWGGWRWIEDAQHQPGVGQNPIARGTVK